MTSNQPSEPETLNQQAVAAPQTNTTKGTTTMERNVSEQPNNEKSTPALTDHDAFADPKLQPDPNRPYPIRIIATNEERAGEQGINAFIPLSKLRNAKHGTTLQRRGIGFALEVEFAYPNGGTYTLTGAWITISPR